LPLARSKEAKPVIKTLTAITLLLASGPVALAKHTQVEGPRLALVIADINSGSVGAMRERDYFEAPQTPFDACRWQPSLFNKTRLAQSCR
jgi:hypothetical protein